MVTDFRNKTTPVMPKKKKEPVVPGSELVPPAPLIPRQTTDLPQPAPQDTNVHTSVSFNKDGTVTVGKGGATSTLSKQEYEASLPGSEKGVKETTPQFEQAVGMREATEEEILQKRLNPVIPPTAEQIGAIQNIGQGIGGIQAPQDGLGEQIVEKGGAAIAGGAGAIAGAKAGAAIGAFASPAGAVVGGVVGAVVGGVGTFFAKLSYDDRQNVKEGYKNYRNAVSNQKAIINAVNSGTLTPEQASQAWNIQTRNLLIARAQLKEKTDTAVGRQLSNGLDEYATVDDYIKYQQPLMTQSLQKAILKPNGAVIIALDDYEGIE